MAKKESNLMVKVGGGFLLGVLVAAGVYTVSKAPSNTYQGFLNVEKTTNETEEITAMDFDELVNLKSLKGNPRFYMDSKIARTAFGEDSRILQEFEEGARVLSLDAAARVALESESGDELVFQKAYFPVSSLKWLTAYDKEGKIFKQDVNFEDLTARLANEVAELKSLTAAEQESIAMYFEDIVKIAALSESKIAALQKAVAAEERVAVTNWDDMPVPGSALAKILTEREVGKIAIAVREKKMDIILPFSRLAREKVVVQGLVNREFIVIMKGLVNAVVEDYGSEVFHCLECKAI